MIVESVSLRLLILIVRRGRERSTTSARDLVPSARIFETEIVRLLEELASWGYVRIDGKFTSRHCPVVHATALGERVADAHGA